LFICELFYVTSAAIAANHSCFNILRRGPGAIALGASKVTHSTFHNIPLSPGSTVAFKYIKIHSVIIYTPKKKRPSKIESPLVFKCIILFYLFTLFSRFFRAYIYLKIKDDFFIYAYILQRSHLKMPLHSQPNCFSALLPILFQLSIHASMVCRLPEFSIEYTRKALNISTFVILHSYPSCRTCCPLHSLPY